MRVTDKAAVDTHQGGGVPDSGHLHGLAVEGDLDVVLSSSHSAALRAPT
jgi:hypothetical protein